MNSPAVNYLTLLEAPQKLWCEWLGGFFDGGSHEIGPSGTGAVTFPTASISFDQSSIPQPLGDGSGAGDVNILVLQQNTDDVQFLTENGKLRIDDMKWDFYVRASNTGPGKGTPAYQCRQATQLLEACLLNDYAVYPLAQKGIFDLEVRQAEPVTSEAYQIRRIRVRGKFDYQFQTIA